MPVSTAASNTSGVAPASKVCNWKLLRLRNVRNIKTVDTYIASISLVKTDRIGRQVHFVS